MPLTHFKVGGELIPVKDAMGGALSFKYPGAYLRTVAGERKLEEKPGSKLHVTQLLRGTRENYLRMLVDYAEDPDGGAFLVVGSSAHVLLANHAGALDEAERAFPDEDVAGTLDMLEEDGTLIDYKTWGSYAVVKALGIIKEGKGKDAVYSRDPDRADLKDLELQMNRYRMYAEKAGLEVKRMKCFVVVRDGGLQIARTRGVDQKTYYLDVPFMDDEKVNGYFDRKRKELLEHLVKRSLHVDKEELTPEEATAGGMPPMCTDKECWDGAKCKGGYCPVAKECAFTGGNPYLEDVQLSEF